jgi:chorismate synthase
MLRFLTAGESHGPGLVAIVEGLPKGLPVSSAELSSELARRRGGHGRGGRMKIEADELEIVGGVRHGRTLGSPVAVLIRNTEWPKWAEVMSVEGDTAGSGITRPRPGHADLAGMLKYDTDDARDILERASARETAARTVVGYLSRLLLETVGADVISQVVAIGPVRASIPPPDPALRSDIEASPVRCPDRESSERMVAAIDAARDAKDTLGGVFEVGAVGIPPGIGSHVHHDRRLDGLLAGAIMSIPGIKGVELGSGFEGSVNRGSVAHDEIGSGLTRSTNRAGGVEGGMSNGEPIVVRAAMKPLSTLMRPLQTVDLATGEPAVAVRERSDVCSVPAAGVVGEQMVAYVLASEMLRKFGGDTVGDFTEAVAHYRSRVAER